MRLIKLWNRLSNLGVHAYHNREETKRIALTNQFGVLGILTLLVAAVFNLPIGLYANTFGLLLTMAVFIFALFINHAGYNRVAVAVLFLASNSVVCFFDNYLGSKAGVFIFYFPIILATILITSIQNKFRFLLLGALPVLGLMMVDFNTMPLNHLISDEVYGRILRVNLIVNTFIIFCLGYLIILINRRAEREIRQSRSKYSALVESTTDANILLDKNAKIRAFNAVAGNNARKHYNKVIRIGDAMLEHIPDMKEAFQKEFNIALTGRVVNVERQINFTNTPVWFNINYYPAYDSEGNIIGVAFNATDIDKRKKMEEALKKSKEQLELVIESSDDGYWDWDFRTNEIYFSPRWKELLGYKDEELPNTVEMWKQVMFEEDCEEMFQLIEAYRNQEIEHLYVIHRYIHKNQSTVYLEVRATYRTDEKGRVIRMVGSHNDLTKIKRAEEEMLAQNDVLKKVNKELDQFVYSVSHDLRAPIASLLGLVTLAREEKNIEQLQEFLDMKEKSLYRLDEFIRDIVNYSRNTRLEITNISIDFKALIEEVWVGLDFMSKISSVEKEVVVKETVPFISDTIRIKIILNNLLSNAIRYADISKERAFVKVAVDINEKEAVIEVMDNGQGIPQKYLGRIFEMFFRASEKNTGSGLGLYIVRETLEKLNGDIEVKSDLGIGTSILVKVPNASLG